MNDLSSGPTPSSNPNPRSPRRVWQGAAVGAAPALVALLFRGENLVIGLSILSGTIWPLLAIILTAIPSTRRFGLGMLLGVGFALLVLVAACQGGWVLKR